MSLIQIVPNKQYKPSKEKATLASPDPNDVAYIALAHHLNCALWSDDKALKQQSLVSVVSTKELLSHTRL